MNKRLVAIILVGLSVIILVLLFFSLKNRETFGSRISASKDVVEQNAPGYEDNTNNVAVVKDKLTKSILYDSKKYSERLATSTYELQDTGTAIGMIRTTNDSADDLYLQIHNTITALVSGTTAVDNSAGDIVFLLPAGETTFIGASDMPSSQMYFDTGVIYGISTVSSTYTAYATSTDIYMTVLYE